MIRCFEEMKNTLPETVVVSNEKIFKKIDKNGKKGSFNTMEIHC